jgi:hypothetical protein
MAKGFNENELKIVNSRLKRLSELPGTDMADILKKLTGDIKKDVINSAPVDSGNLRNSVYTKSDSQMAKVWVDTRPTETRNSSKRYNYGRTVEHGRAGRYKTTPYFYKVIEGTLGKLVTMINNKIRDYKINS